MVPLWHPLQLLLVALAGWINQQQRDIDYLQEETASYGSSWDLGGFGSPTISEFG
jgi:hypothetical protein